MTGQSRSPKLTSGTVNLIDRIQNKEVRDLLKKGLHPAEVVEGWYFALASGILTIQEKK